MTRLHNIETEFDTVISRKNTQSDKWSRYSDDVIPLWVADMDFASPSIIKDAISERLKHGIFGYTAASESLYNSIKNHLSKHYQWTISDSSIVNLPGLVCALHSGVRTFSNQGDGIVVPGPVYYHLTKAAELSEREVLHVEMKLDNQQRWLPDFDELKIACAKENSRMLLLCNPHNPGGTVYTKEELKRIHEMAKQNDLIVISDEIHCDLILEDVPHVPFASLNDDAKSRTITLMAPSKTFNIAGLGFAFAIIENSKLRNQFNKGKNGIVPSPNLLGLVAAQAAYENGNEWHAQLLEYLKDNRDFIRAKLKDTPIKFASLEATYLEWLDVSELKLNNPHTFFLEAGVGLSDGKDFGNSQFLRLNFGCPRAILEKALDRMVDAMKQLP
ncbi:pyridoxal phosphate-dependent aminotransferase [Marinomonas sp. 15G1-11]|uniref:cysteine-S-conjugate beta-lyase n=1 Tax=Marinomonas phaeophyticola TaxID=3004091 RepID=A0ABT4JNW1_9GAMM|nr:MalY/PatB family protein [Marinomonas sp. 15G1-11]MCZ2720070.1 pyridoxal phosphate-dependent aminotransferase [Marinomonas sp. 15G1-11]